MKKFVFLALFVMAALSVTARETYNFNIGWTLGAGQSVSLPRAWNEDEAFLVRSAVMRDSIVTYTKHFQLPQSAKGKRVIVEFEGVRQAAEVAVNGRTVGLHENGVMAFGLDITDCIKEGDNVITVVADNHWNYKERSTGIFYQWQSRNFYANYGGINKNVRLHIVPQVYQTLPLYSHLGTTGQYVYATNIDVKGHKATINAETEVRNTTDKAAQLTYEVVLCEYDGTEKTRFSGGRITVDAGCSVTLKAAKRIGGLHFWSWGYGYLYKVKTIVKVATADGEKYTDEVTTTTGFRKTAFTDGYLRLNDRAIMIHGYAQRSTNEWPGVGCCVPSWLSDYSNNLLVESGGNLVRWMHVTPSKQDIESCDRVGLLQAMPAADAEKDVKGRQWEQRVEVMRDAIIYNRNNPSIIFYESGNHSITEQHIADMKTVRDKYDPYGGRAIGSREMLTSEIAEYGGEMLYVNKSDTKPLWMMEYCRDEALRFYWNAWCYPYHADGAGPRYRNGSSASYNRNQDSFTEELVDRWYEYWAERPGQGTMVNAGGAKIVFSDTQTHGRGEESYRRSGVVDAMRIPKDAFFAHQVMWDGWVDDLKPRTYIVGHWTYDTEDERTKTEQKNPAEGKARFLVPTVMVVSNSDSVQLLLNGKPVKQSCVRSSKFLYKFTNVPYERGTLTAIGYDKAGNEQSRYSVATAGKAVRLMLTPITNPAGWRADGADVALVQVEVVDADGNRCPVDNSLVSFSLEGEAEWRGGIAKGKDNYVLRRTLPVECGVNRVMLRSTQKAGTVRLTATAEGLASASVELVTMAVEVSNGLAITMPDNGLQPMLTRGETPITPSFTQQAVDIPIAKVEAGSNVDKAICVCDKNEYASWESDGSGDGDWVRLFLKEKTTVDEISIKMCNARSMSYPVVVYADNEEVFRGRTPQSLGYVRLKLRPVEASTITIKGAGQSRHGGKISELVEVDPSVGEKKIAASKRLRVCELQLIHRINKQ